MSREFGSCSSGYFDSQMEYAAEDLRGGSDGISRAWAVFFAEFQHVAYAIASSEAGDSGECHPIMETMKRMNALKAALDGVERYVQPFRDVAEEAVRQATT